jgi:hypothetical protein
MSELDFFDLSKPSRPPSAKEEAKFREAFAALLAADPTRPPGPKPLADAMGWGTRQLPGRLSKLRRRMLREAGFAQSDRDSRWHSPIGVWESGAAGRQWEARCRTHPPGLDAELYLTDLGAVAFNTRGVGNRTRELAVLAASRHMKEKHT